MLKLYYFEEGYGLLKMNFKLTLSVGFLTYKYHLSFQ